MPLSKSEAIRESAGIGRISGRGTSWQVHGPYRITQPAGPSTTINADSYPNARRIATQWRAEVALYLMGAWSDDVRNAVESHGCDYYADHTLAGFIVAGLKAAAA
jgi:hypothetical protein